MTISHTPGPWIVRADPFPPDDANGHPMNGLEAVFHTIGKDTLMAIAEHVLPADARLIAAAPDMLAALRKCLGVIESMPYEPSIAPSTRAQDAAVDAIAKATGGTDR